MLLHHYTANQLILTVSEVFQKKKFIPLGIGGGIKNFEDAYKLFLNGADKIVINTTGLNSPKLLEEIALTYGNQSIIVHIESKKINGEYYCFTECGRNNSGVKVSDWINQLNENIAGEILLQSIDHDGLMEGFDKNLFEIGMKYSKIPVILSSGFSSIENVEEAIRKFEPSGVCISSSLHYGKIAIKDLINL